MFLENSICDACGAKLGVLKLHSPVYCIPCIEKMESLKMVPKQYKKHIGVKGAFGSQ
ncbi:MAG TPA: hypothetical protein VI934_00275 [Candidatus Nanoarchaeia archaeon]|nr:hypothetical protein [Candidatus Nanoarchaeia archaeon]